MTLPMKSSSDSPTVPRTLTAEQAAAYQTILLTGATGRLGTPLLARLVQMGFKVRVVTPDAPAQLPGVEWVPMDFTAAVDFTEAMKGVSHVLHIGAELWKTEVMEQVNGVASDALVAAAEAAGVKGFLYTSSICVYGSSKVRRVTEETPLIPMEGTSRRHYMEKDFLIEYARSKLMGEVAIRKHAARCRYVILRPTEITWEKDILKPALQWSFGTRIWRGNRHVHQVYYKDVVNAVVFFLLRLGQPPDQLIQTYNLSNDDTPEPRYFDFLTQAWNELRDARFRTPVAAPLWMEYLKEHVKWKVWEHRYPLGLTYIDPSHLYSTGYRHEHGLGEARRAAIKLWPEMAPSA